MKNCDAASRIARNNKIFYELAETKKFVTLLVKYLCIIEPEGSDKQWVRILKKIKVGDDFEGQAHRERILRKTSAHDFQKAEQRLIKACSMLITELSEELKEGAVCR